MTHPLDTPVWTALGTLHRDLALTSGTLARYPPAIAPFLGLPAGGRLEAADLEALVPPGDTVYLLGPAPPPPPGWALEPLGRLHQLVCEGPVPPPPGPPPRLLGPGDLPEVLALTALVYPHYFRPRTTELGPYLGLHAGGRLAAMIGQRMGGAGYREVSAVCTHPDFAGRGLARRLLAFLSGELQRQGLVPFLHVSPANARAERLYLEGGYRLRAEVDFWSLRRQAA